MLQSSSFNVAASLITLLITGPVLAAEPTDASSWTGEAELGYISTSGNTDTNTLNSKAKLINDRIQWKHTFIAEATRSSDKDVITARRSFLSGKSDYKLGEKSYLFGLFEYEDDRFSGFDYQASLTAGYGRKLIGREYLTWDAELGAGREQRKLISDGKDSEAIVYAGTEVNWKISESASFNEKLTVKNGDATTTKSVSAIKARINSKLATKITYTIKHVSEVPPGIDKTDEEFAVTLVYNF